MSQPVRTGQNDSVGDALAALAALVPGSLVIDVGGGSGTRAVPLAARGCRVIVVDSSIDALAILRRRAVDAGVSDRIEAVQADADRLASVVTPHEADLVLCHHLLEELEDPAVAIAGLAAVLKPGGIASVLAAGRFAAVLGQAIAGRFAAAAAILGDPDGRFGLADPLRRRFDVAGLEALLRSSGLVVESIVGVGVVSALTPTRQTFPVDDPTALGLEDALSEHRVLREIGADLHAIARLPIDGG